MGDFADVKRKRMLSFLEWLGNKPDIVVEDGGRHQVLVKHPKFSRPFLVPTKHNRINKHIVKALMNELVKHKILTEEEFRNRL